MSKEEVRNTNARYYSIIDGTFRTNVLPSHPDAVQRDWESADGKSSGTKYERIVHALFGTVTSLEFHDGDYGTNLNITLDADEDGISPVFSLGTGTQYGEQMLKFLPNLKENVEYRFRPYSFTDKETGKDVRGIQVTIKGEDDKFTVPVPNFFYDSEKKEALNGYPTPEGDTSKYKSDDWKLFYLQARKFLVKYVEENVLPRFAAKEGYSDKDFQPKPVEYPAEDINPEDIPF